MLFDFLDDRNNSRSWRLRGLCLREIDLLRPVMPARQHLQSLLLSLYCRRCCRQQLWIHGSGGKDVNGVSRRLDRSLILEAAADKFRVRGCRVEEWQRCQAAMFCPEERFHRLM